MTSEPIKSPEKKHVLITGANSYIGTSVEKWLNKYPEKYFVNTLDMKQSSWKEHDFSQYDVVFHVAGIAHVDVGNATDEQKQLYYKVNRDLAIETAKKAKESGVKQFIFMSSIIVYGSNPAPENNNIITSETLPKPDNFYGDSKLQAEKGLIPLSDENFKVVILRPPMIYGKGCKGNYRLLEKLAQFCPIFPNIENKRSLFNINSLCDFIKIIIDKQKSGLFFPQDKEYICTSELYKRLAQNNNKKVTLTRIFNPLIEFLFIFNNKLSRLVKKAFCNLAYDKSLNHIDFKKLPSNYSKKNRVLVLASVASMIEQFNMNNIELLQNLGYEVHVACNFEQGSNLSKERTEVFKAELKENNIKFFQIDFSRSPYDILDNIKAISQLNSLFQTYEYSFIHCHAPVPSVIGRLIAYKYGVKSIYTAHGFHFYKGAPILNWCLYFPVELVCSFITDTLITINKEDFEFASKNLHARKNIYIPGIGVNIDKFSLYKFDKLLKRKEFGLDESNIVLLSIGELNKRKNHEIVLNLISKIDNDNLIYLIVGKGNLNNYLQKKCKKLQIQDKVKLLGYRTDIPELLSMSDIFLLPSIHEGLPVSLMEAMASGLPCIASNIRGCKDLLQENNPNIQLFDLNNEKQLISSINELVKNNDLRKEIGLINKNFILNFSIDNINKYLNELYSSIGN